MPWCLSPTNFKLSPPPLLNWLQDMGIIVDEARNQALVGGAEGSFSATGSKVELMVIPTDEELSIAQQTLEVVHSNPKRVANAA